MRALGLTAGSLCLVLLGFFAGQLFRAGPSSSSAGEAGSGAVPSASGASAAARKPVVTARAIMATIRERVTGSGLLEAERSVTVPARVTGQVEILEVEEGNSVAAGALLCAVDRVALEIAELQARSQLARDEADFQRMEELSRRERSIVSTKELQDAGLARDQSRAALERARLELSHAESRAPFAGLVVGRFVDHGQYVNVGDRLFTIADFEPFLVRLHLPESDANRVEVGQPAELRSDREAESVAVGQVLRISPVVDPASLSVEVTVSFDRVPAEVRVGSFVRVDVITRTYADVVVVPRSALLRQKGAPSALFRVDPKQIAHRVEVRTGYEDESVVELIEGGLAEYDLVIVEGHRELNDQDPVHEYRRVAVTGNPLSVIPQSDPQEPHRGG
ncbi:MAG: efflux RND transporter periplasmic adaptor subunit [Planctomycetota bacterium]